MLRAELPPQKAEHRHKLTCQKSAPLGNGKPAHPVDEPSREGEKIDHRTWPPALGLGPPGRWSEVGVHVIGTMALNGKDQPNIGIRDVIKRVVFRSLVSAV